MNPQEFNSPKSQQDSRTDWYNLENSGEIPRSSQMRATGQAVASSSRDGINELIDMPIKNSDISTTKKS